MNFEKYLKESEIIDYSHPKIQALAKELAKDCKDDEEIVKNCFVYVRDKVIHSGDCKADITTLKASDVLENKTGWCYAKAHLLAALLRANNIPTGLSYQRLSCGEYLDDIYCFHGLNAVYLQKYGWYRIDPRGNKKGVDAQFSPPKEKLAFELQENEYDIAGIYGEPLEVIVKALQTYKNYDEMIHNIPDEDEFICKITPKDAKRLNELSGNLLPYIFEKGVVPPWFSKDFSVKAFEEKIQNTQYQHFGYVLDNIIVGYIAIKEGNHLFNLFVDEKYHKKGIAKKLWEFVVENFEFDSMGTNASLYAIKVYKSFGFEKSAEVQTYMDALEFQPMVFKRNL